MTERDNIDCMYDCALEVALLEGKVTTSLLQTRLSIGYKRAKRLVSLVKNTSFISPSGGVLSVEDCSKIYRKNIKPKSVEDIAENDNYLVDDKYFDALEIAKTRGHISINIMMKELKIGYPRAARIKDELAVCGEIEINVNHRRSKYIK